MDARPRRWTDPITLDRDPGARPLGPDAAVPRGAAESRGMLPGRDRRRRRRVERRHVGSCPLVRGSAATCSKRDQSGVRARLQRGSPCDHRRRHRLPEQRHRPPEGWLAALLAYAERNPGAAIIGARLLYPDGTVQHAGVVIGQDRLPSSIYTRDFRGTTLRFCARDGCMRCLPPARWCNAGPSRRRAASTSSIATGLRTWISA